MKNNLWPRVIILESLLLLLCGMGMIAHGKHFTYPYSVISQTGGVFSVALGIVLFAGRCLFCGQWRVPGKHTCRR